MSGLFREISSHLRRLLRGISHGWAPYRAERVDPEDLRFSMNQNSIPSYGFLLMLSLSTVIATLGLIADSAPSIIGAMIIAPLMSPIISGAYGIAIFDYRLMIRSAITIAIGTGLVILLSYAAVGFFGLRVAGSEILARTSPSFLDLGVALAAGCAGAFAQTRPSIANSVAGVAIAVALVPPLAVTGIGLSLGAKATSESGLSLSEFGLYSGGTDVAAGAFTLYLTNLVGILVVAALVFVAQRYGSWKRSFVTIAVILVVSILMVPALNNALHEVYVKNRVLRLAAKSSSARAGWLQENSMDRIERLEVHYRDGVLVVSVDMLATRDHIIGVQDRLDRVQQRLTAEIGEPVMLEIDIVPIEILQLRSGPTPVDE